MINITLTDRDQATILAALRHYQHDMTLGGARVAHVEDIATGAGRGAAMNARDVDVLCLRLLRSPELPDLGTATPSPFPWTADTERSPARLMAADGDCIAMVYLTVQGKRGRSARHLANLRMMQASGALLEACEAAEHWLTEETANPGETTPGAILDVLRGAIAEATGNPAPAAENAA